MEINPEHLASCGLYCGVCGVWLATRDGNTRFMERLVGVYKGQLPGSETLTVEDLQCEDCLSQRTSLFCRVCNIKRCVEERGYSGCQQCDAFPCEKVDAFPVPVGKRVILRAIPHWREVGTEQFVRDEEARYLCPHCGHKLFRGAKRCNQCKTDVDLD